MSELRKTLRDAIGACDVEAVRRVLGAGADPNSSVTANHSTPLVFLCARAVSANPSSWPHDERATVACAAALIEGGASPNLIPGQPEPIRSPLYFAAQSKFPGLVSLLLGANADVHYATADGHTSLHIASRGKYSHVETVVALIAAGADVNARYLQKTPLDEAVLFSNPRVYSTLLRAGSALPTEQSYIREGPYFLKVRRAGGFKQYEAQVKKSLAAMLVPKFPQIPAEVIPTVVEFWAHAGDY